MFKGLRSILYVISCRQQSRLWTMNEDVKILDGGLATELEADGFQIQGDPLWSARILQSNPQAIIDVHSRYLCSGADIITTATYQATVEGFMKHLELNVQQAVEVIQSGVTLAKKAVEKFSLNCKSKGRRPPQVAGSIGPYGVFLHDGSEYNGNYVDTITLEELKAWHRHQMQCLVTAGVDIIAMETIPSQKEAEALVGLLREFPNTKAWLSFSCKDERLTCHGEPFEEAVKLSAKSEQLVAIGINCSSPELISPLLTSAERSKHPSIDWIVYPNSGESWDVNSGWQVCSSKRSLASLAMEWKQMGATWIGTGMGYRKHGYKHGTGLGHGKDGDKQGTGLGHGKGGDKHGTGLGHGKGGDKHAGLDQSLGERARCSSYSGKCRRKCNQDEKETHHRCGYFKNKCCISAIPVRKIGK
ncbi:homocysteine S-methyltransferase 1-like isoform X3 [Protopterus annectens]|uniref:homocysteine S-methyltransferase 1-like isoform X3 n=1 Tax=Protopterus annectens TaxID=7888 RepID=UPI001CFB95A9|nr:homocysteine S-methyltransferase 1-like isoform X3 [Protopterus annectens]